MNLKEEIEGIRDSRPTISTYQKPVEKHIYQDDGKAMERLKTIAAIGGIIAALTLQGILASNVGKEKEETPKYVPTTRKEEVKQDKYSGFRNSQKVSASSYIQSSGEEVVYHVPNFDRDR